MLSPPAEGVSATRHIGQFRQRLFDDMSALATVDCHSHTMGLDKGAEFYLASPTFWTKMGLLAAILVLEVWPMVTFIRWRIARRRGRAINTHSATRLYAVNQLQLALVVAMVFVASAMARRPVTARSAGTPGCAG